MNRILQLTGAVLAAVLAAGCSLIGAQQESAGRTVTLVTHDSFAVDEQALAEFERESGIHVEVRHSGDAGELTNQLVLTKGSPVADVVFGIDTTFASRAVSEGVLAAHTPADLPASAEEHLLEGGETVLTPVGEQDMAWTIGDRGFDMILSRYVPHIIEEHIVSALEPILAGVPGAHAEPSTAIEHWAVHPGGRSILDRVQYDDGGSCFNRCVSGRTARRCQSAEREERQNCCSWACNRRNNWHYRSWY